MDKASGTLIAEVQRRLNYDARSYNFFQKQHLLQLVLLDYRPITRWRDGIEEYLYVDAYDANGKMFYMSRRSLKLNKDGELAHESVGGIDDILPGMAKEFSFADEVSVFTGAPVVEGVGPENGKIVRVGTGSAIRFLRRSIELQALLFETEEFFGFESCILSERNANRFGNIAIGEVMPAKGQNLGRRQWMQRVYNTFMLYRNIELTHYYFNNLVPPNIEVYFELNRVCVFDEYIPLTYKFTSIYNPLVDNGDIFEGASKIFNTALTVTPLSMVGGSIYASARDQRESFGLYTDRLTMSRLFNKRLSKERTSELMNDNWLPIRKAKQTCEFYSPKFYMTLYLTRLIEATNARDAFILMGLDTEVYIKCEESEVDTDMGYRWDFRNLDVDTIRIGTDNGGRKEKLSDVLFIEYLSFVFTAVNATRAFGRRLPVANVAEDLKGASNR